MVLTIDLVEGNPDHAAMNSVQYISIAVTS